MEKIRRIGVFDSGLGGLTVLNELCRYHRGLELVYFGDTARVPYGSRTPKTIVQYAKQDMRFLQQQGVQGVVIACGTVSANCIESLRREFSLPIVGVIEPAVETALELSQNKRIGVIGTKATVDSRSYERSLRSKCPEAVVYSIACPLFVPLVENGFQSDDMITRLTVERYLSGFSDTGVDTLIMGCTHYPFLVDAFKEYLPGVHFVHSGKALSQRLNDYFPLEPGQGENTLSYYFSDASTDFIHTAGSRLDCLSISGEQTVDITEY